MANSIVAIGLLFGVEVYRLLLCWWMCEGMLYEEGGCVYECCMRKVDVCWDVV